jgi:hypothetical protein
MTENVWPINSFSMILQNFCDFWYFISGKELWVVTEVWNILKDDWFE